MTYQWSIHEAFFTFSVAVLFVCNYIIFIYYVFQDLCLPGIQKCIYFSVFYCACSRESLLKLCDPRIQTIYRMYHQYSHICTC